MYIYMSVCVCVCIHMKLLGEAREFIYQAVLDRWCAFTYHKTLHNHTLNSRVF